MVSLGLIGHPVRHSLSKIMHEAAFKELDIEGSYRLFDVGPEGIDWFLQTDGGELDGFNVTIPNKVEVIQHLDVLSRGAELIGAVNTVKNQDGCLTGFNTDGTGFIESLRDVGEDVEGRETLIFGAGGAARALAYQILLDGGQVKFCVRREDLETALNLSSEIKHQLGNEVRVHVLDEAEGLLNSCEIMVNATPLGMKPNTEEAVVDVELIPEDVLVVDIVYNPVETKLIRQARENGLKTVQGVGMLVHQGAKALEIWLDVDAPIDAMREAVVARLNPKQ